MLEITICWYSNTELIYREYLIFVQKIHMTLQSTQSSIERARRNSIVSLVAYDAIASSHNSVGLVKRCYLATNRSLNAMD